MKTLVRLGALSLFVATCIVLTACAGGTRAPMPSPGSSPYVNDVIRVGDKITIQLSGVPDGGYYVEKQIPPTGDISLPYLSQPFHAAGQSTAQLVQQIIDAYKGQKIYTNPVVSVLEEERYITVGGEVRSPGNIVYRPDLTLVSLINSCGSFTEFADRRHVRIIRGKQTFYVDCIKAVAVPGNDPPVYPGDQVYVSRTPF